MEGNDGASFFQIAVLLGADPKRVGDELRSSLEFEIKLANISLPREERRNASKLYHPMQLNEVSGSVAPLVDDWTEYINRILTEDVIQVRGCSEILQKQRNSHCFAYG